MSISMSLRRGSRVLPPGLLSISPFIDGLDRAFSSSAACSDVKLGFPSATGTIPTGEYPVNVGARAFGASRAFAFRASFDLDATSTRGQGMYWSSRADLRVRPGSLTRATRSLDLQGARALHSTPSMRYALGDVTTIDVPSLGAESISEATVGSLIKAVGDTVEEDEVIAQLETDKVTIDVKYQGSGVAVVKKYYVGEGDTVNVGDQFADVEEAEAGSVSSATSQETPSPATESTNNAGKAEKTKKTEKTEKKHAPAATPAAPVASPAPASPPPSSADRHRPERRVKMTRLRKRVAERLKGSQNTYAMLTTFQECDMTALMMMRNTYKDEFLDKHGVKLGFMSAFIKASANALQYVPSVNAVIEEDEIVYRDFIDVSVAVSTPKGLVVPVLRNVESMSFADIEKNINELGRKARDGSLSIDEMAGGTFTISNGGVFGSLMGTPIINPPQSAILGMHSIQQRPAVVDGQVVPRPMMYLALTYDHRLIDGREAVTALKRIKEIIEDPKRLLLDV